MDGLSAVAGVATAGVQLSKSLYDLYSTVKASRQEIEDVANNVSLLAMVLEELNGVICDDGLNFKPDLQKAAQSIARRCATLFEDIHKHTGAGLDVKGRSFYEKLGWYFKRERVKSLRSSLESLKSTLNILLHVVQFAKSTKGIEEYPGVKPIGNWYVRRERRGLVCLVIDNRHALERLKHLEDQESHIDLDTIEDELPLAFADIFPLSTSDHRRGQSPERKFVVAFGKRKIGESRGSEEAKTHRPQAEPSTPNDDRLLLPYSPRGHRGHRDHFMDSDAAIVGPSTLFQSTRASRTGASSIKEQETSRLILDIIPHEKADLIFQSAQNMSRSKLLEVMAEETIDMLMREWTYVDPKYISEDDRSSSTEPSLPTRRDENTQSAYEESIIEHAEGLNIPSDVSRGQKSDNLTNSCFRKGSDGGQIASMEEIPNGSSSFPAVRSRKKKKTPSPLLPTYKHPEGDGGAMGKTPFSTKSSQGYQSTNEPATPAPPYPSRQTGQCPSCRAGSPGASTSHAGTYPDQQIDARAQDTKETRSSIDSALRLFENKNLEILEQLRLKQLQKAAQQQGDHHQSIIIEQEADPVILKDCLGRRFLFPIEKCRSWQSMENLIKTSFYNVGSMYSQVFRGNYDILSPTGEIILPEIWGTVIKPGWVVELRFWDFSGAQERSPKTLDVDVMETAPAVPNSPTYSRTSPAVHLVTAKLRASLKTWLGSRKSTPSVALE